MSSRIGDKLASLFLHMYGLDCCYEIIESIGKKRRGVAVSTSDSARRLFSIQDLRCLNKRPLQFINMVVPR